MKKRAFLQALILVMLLTGSWLILLFRLNRDASPQQVQSTAVPDPVEASSANQADTGISPVSKGDGPEIQVPPAWQEWTGYLDSQANRQELELALEAMRESLFSLPREDARAHLVDLINSGFNRRTGMRFRIGRDGALLAAPELQTLLLDWLARLDPVMAAETAKVTLQKSGTSLGADAFVIHLRNYTKGTQDPPGERDLFIREQFTELLSNPAWMKQPAASIAHSMDFAVFLGDGSLVRELSGLMAPGAPPGIAHASSMAIERLMDIDPLYAAAALVDTMEQPGMHSTTRAGFLARLDPEEPRSFELLGEYLSNPATSREEAVAFLQYFPNLNKTFSHNLVSPEISITGADNHMERLKTALEAVRDWQADGVRRDISGELRSAEQRLTSQITGNPVP